MSDIIVLWESGDLGRGDLGVRGRNPAVGRLPAQGRSQGPGRR